MIETIPWLVVWGFLKPVFKDYLDPEKYIQNTLKDLVKGQEKDIRKKVFGLFKKDPKESDDGIYLYGAFVTSYKNAIERCFYEWQGLDEVRDTDLLREQMILLKSLKEEKQIIELFGSSDSEKEEEVLDTILVQGVPDDRLLTILKNGPVAKILDIVNTQAETTQNINQKDQIGIEGKLLADGIEKNLINYILAGLRKEIHYNDKFYRTVTYDSLREIRSYLKNLDISGASIAGKKDWEKAIQELGEKMDANKISLSDEAKEELDARLTNNFCKFSDMQKVELLHLGKTIQKEAVGIRNELSKTEQKLIAEHKKTQDMLVEQGEKGIEKTEEVGEKVIDKVEEGNTKIIEELQDLKKEKSTEKIEKKVVQNAEKIYNIEKIDHAEFN